MFSGIVTHIGTVARIDQSGGDWAVYIRSTLPVDRMGKGSSVSVSGCCLTVVDQHQDWFACNVSAETLSKTIIGSWQVGTPVNLEASLRMGDEISGHLVSGHIDGLARVQSIKPEGDSYRFKIALPPAFAPYLAPKGSIALDGISLTVNEVEGEVFGVNIIPYTWMHTTLRDRKVGDLLNFEVDQIARYVARQLGKV